LGLIGIKSICLQIGVVLTYSLPICIPFISTSYLLALTKKSKTMLYRSGESGHPYLIPDLRGNGFSFSPLSMMLAMGLSYVAFIMLKYIPSITVSSELLS
jgi:hypothetical protein